MIRIGQGFDVHRLVLGKPCIIGGVHIEHTHGLEGHSDADVLLHAICDALLGSIGKGDIGQHFPDTNPAIKGINSREILRSVISIVQKEKYEIVNIDCTVICENPKISPHTKKMIKYISEDCQCSESQINIKATTTERMGSLGRDEGIAAQAVCIVTTV
ncbi:2-C-methyl-D-erythritol 2,4-cyclodiphosphate synthase [Methylophilaceae bacterium]|nr:2-C-methyl-D-erythritol 2,4-cyclodiphosphate synthase [Methylophilaceae bacterium]